MKWIAQIEVAPKIKTKLENKNKMQKIFKESKNKNQSNIFWLKWPNYTLCRYLNDKCRCLVCWATNSEKNAHKIQINSHNFSNAVNAVASNAVAPDAKETNCNKIR